MSQLDKQMIHRLSRLSRIHTSEDEEEQLLKDLSSILDYAEQLQEIDTEDVPPCNMVQEELSNITRADEVKNLMPREKLLMNAPDQIGGMIRVPPVLRKTP